MADRRRPLTRAEVGELAASIRRWLDGIEAGELEATPAMVRHLEGAVVALEAVLGEPFSLPVSRADDSACSSSGNDE